MSNRVALKLDSNEGPLSPPALLAALATLDPEALRRYPDVSTLEATLASRVGVAPDRVIVTAGADDAIDRVCRAYLGAGRTMLRSEPTFEMFDHFAKLSGARGQVPARGVPHPARGATSGDRRRVAQQPDRSCGDRGGHPMSGRGGSKRRGITRSCVRRIRG